MADIKKILTAASVVGGIGIVVLILLAILLGFETSIRNGASAELNVTLGETNSTTAVGTTGQYPFLQTATCRNNTNPTSFNASLYEVDTGGRDGGGLILLYADSQGDEWENDPVDCDITYLADNDASNANGDFIAALRIFATFAGVLIIGLLGYALYALFGGSGKGKKLV